MMKRLYAAALLFALMAPAANAGPSAAPTPSAAEVAGLRLTSPFTLVYAVTVQDVRAPTLRLAQSGTRDPMPDNNSLITVSARDGRLLYRTARGKVVILDGQCAYEGGGDGKMGSVWADQGWVGKAYHNENVDRLPFLPLPGVGLPGVALIQSPVLLKLIGAGQVRFTGRVPRLNFIGDGTYFPGTIDVVRVGGRLRTVSLTVRSDIVNEAWTFGAYRQFQGHWVATRMRMRQSEGDAPTFVSTYTLVKAVPAAPDAAQFDLRTYLVKGANVFDMTGIRGSVNYVYDPQAGDLQAQADRARLAQAAQGQP